MATAKTKKKTKKTKITVGKTPRFNGRVGVVPCNGYSNNPDGTTRHIISGSMRTPEPLCGEPIYYGSWIASTGAKVHKRPICKKCLKALEAINQAVSEDPSWTTEEERLQAGIEGLLKIIEEYGEWVEQDE